MENFAGLFGQIEEIKKDLDIVENNLPGLFYEYRAKMRCKAERRPRGFLRSFAGVVRDDHIMDYDVFDYLFDRAVTGYLHTAPMPLYRAALDLGLGENLANDMEPGLSETMLAHRFAVNMAAFMSTSESDMKSAFRVAADIVYAVSPEALKTLENLGSEKRHRMEQGNGYEKYTKSVPHPADDDGDEQYEAAVRFTEMAEKEEHHYLKEFLYKDACMCAEKAQQCGNTEVLYLLGDMCFYGHGTCEDREAAVELYTAGAENGDDYCRFRMYECLMNGWGTEKNTDAAMEYLKRAADNEYARASCRLGVHYEEGRYIEKNIKKAIRCYKHAAGSDGGEASRRLGLIYKEGRGGVTPDPEKAVRYYEFAYKCGDAEGTYLYAIEKMETVSLADYAAGIDILREAIERGSAKAMYIYGKNQASEVRRRRWAAEALRRGIAVEKRQLDWVWKSETRGMFCLEKLEEFLTKHPEYTEGRYRPELFGRIYMENSHKNDSVNAQKGFKYFIMGGNAGNARCWYYLGIMYENGIAVGQDIRKACEEYRRAGAAGVVEAQFALLGAVKKLYPGKRGRKIADELYCLIHPDFLNEKLSEMSIPDCAALMNEISRGGTDILLLEGVCADYETSCEGRDTNKYIPIRHIVNICRDKLHDREREMKYTLMGADMGFPDLLYEAGELYADPESGIYDRERAMNCFLRAAEYGELRAMKRMGDMYCTWEDYDIDPKAARKWYTLAAEAGNEEAAAALKALPDDLAGNDDDKDGE